MADERPSLWKDTPDDEWETPTPNEDPNDDDELEFNDASTLLGHWRHQGYVREVLLNIKTIIDKLKY